MEVTEKRISITSTEEYTFKVSRESHVAKVEAQGLGRVGWVSNRDSSGGIPDNVVEAAREFLLTVKPELDSKVIFAKKAAEDARVPPKLGECCEAMRLVLPRTLLLQHKHGLGIMELINTDTGVIKRYVSLKFPKNPDKLAPHAKTTTIALNFCPFCGVKLEGESETSFEETEEKAGPASKTAVPAAEGDRRQEGKARGGARGLPAKRGNTTGRSRGKK